MLGLSSFAAASWAERSSSEKKSMLHGQCLLGRELHLIDIYLGSYLDSGSPEAFWELSSLKLCLQAKLLSMLLS